MSSEQGQQHQAPDADAGSIPERATRTAIDLSACLLWDGEHSYVVAQEDGHVRTLAVHSNAFRRWVVQKCRAAGSRVPSTPQAWQAVRLELDARAEQDGERAHPSIRVASKGGATFVDLGGDDWTCARITADGWEVVPHPADGPYFYRPPRMMALPAPERGGTPDDLWRFISVGERSRRFLLAWLVCALRSKGPYPVLPINGSHGSTKTTLSSAVKALTDPTHSSDETPAVTSPRKPPREERDVVSTARNNRVVAFDNISYLDQWLADAICRLSTGAELGGRAMYTDFDEAVFTASRPVVLNGIPDVIGYSDLADRCIPGVEALKPANRLSEAEFWHAFEAAWPVLLGVVLDLVSTAMRHWNDARPLVSEDVRMRDFARAGEALGIEFGWEPGEFTRLYAEAQSSAASSIAQADPIFAPLEKAIAASDGEWVGTMAQLLAELNRHSDVGSKSADWPKSPRGLSNKLARLGPALAETGFEVSAPRAVNGRDVRTIARRSDP
jgi:hypothetical protein